LQFLLFGGEDADIFRRGLVMAFVLPLAISTPLLLLLCLKAHELSALNQQSIHERAQDSLTSCLNGPLFSAMVDAYPSLMGPRAGRQTGSLLMVDVDHLRVLNERIGHRAGDQALRVLPGQFVHRCEVATWSDASEVMNSESFCQELPGTTPRRSRNASGMP
jgi:diguanylate cyclase